MNRKELVSEIAKRTDVAMGQINHLLDNVVDIITEAMSNGREVALKGFGTFAVAKRAARVGRNPQTGAKIKIGASKAPKFRPSSQLKEAVRTGKKKAAPKKAAAKKAAPKKAAPAKATKKAVAKKPAAKAKGAKK